MTPTSTQCPADPRRAFFEQHAAHWDDDAAAQAQVRSRLRALRPQLGVRPGWEVLEVGCGTGQITDLLVEWVHPGGRVMAVDFAPAMLARARAKVISAEFREADICLVPPARRVFNLVLCFQSFPHFRDPAAALRHVAEALKPGGRLVILHLAGTAQVNAFHRQVGAAVASDRLPAPEEWPARLEEAGFRMVRCTDEPELFLVEATLVS